MRFLSLAFILAALMLAGCTAQNYSASSANINTLTSTGKNQLHPVALPSFTASDNGQTHILCRLGSTIQPPAGATYAEYIHDAMQQELTDAKLYNSNSSRVLRGNLDKINFSTSLRHSRWVIQMTFNDGKQAPYTITNTYDFTSKFDEAMACTQVASMLKPAVQSFLGKVYADPRFQRSLKSN